MKAAISSLGSEMWRQNGGGEDDMVNSGGYSPINRDVKGADLAHRQVREGTASRGCAPLDLHSQAFSPCGVMGTKQTHRKYLLNVPWCHHLYTSLPERHLDSHPLTLGNPRCHSLAVFVGGRTGIFIPIQWVA